MAENPRIEELRRRLEREPGSRLFAQLAEELRKEGEHEEAIRVARTGLAQQPNYPSARMTLGRALLESGDLPAARLEFETVLRGAPDNILASRFLAECLEGVGDLGSALLQYRAAQRLAPADKNVEAQIRALEQKLSAPTMVRKGPEGHAPGPAPASPPPAAPAPVAEAAGSARTTVPPRPPLPPPRTASATAEFEVQAPAPAAVAEPPLRPPLPAPPEPEPPAAPTLVEESFDLEAPFNVPSPLRAEPSSLPGRSLPDEKEASEAPTLPATPAPVFDFTPSSSLASEPVLLPEAPRPQPVEAGPVRMAPPSLPPEPPLPAPAMPAPPIRVAPPPIPIALPSTASEGVPLGGPPAPDPVLDTGWRAPAPPRVRALEETQEVGARERAASPASDSVDTTRVPVVTFPISPPSAAPPPKPPLDAIRLEWAPAPDAPGAPAPSAEAVPPAAPPPVPAAPAPVAPLAPSAPASPASAPAEPLLSPTLAELYFGQGALDKALETYEQLLEREPTNERYRARLAEIRRSSPPAADEERSARRRVIEGQIMRLEQLLALVKRA